MTILSGRRADRVADEVRQAIAALLLREVKDPRVGFVTITGVKMSNDLRHARVYFSVIGDAEVRRRSLAGLRSATGFVRRQVGRRLRLRFTPELEFHLDPGPERAERLAQILRRDSHERD